MSKINLIKTCATLAAFALFAPINSSAQSDSTNTVRLTGVPIVKLRNQERETPVTNNITNTTQQITQVVTPNTYQVSASGDGIGTAAAAIGCGGDALVGGGGSCYDGAGLVAVGSSIPYAGNGWYIGCQSLNGNYLSAVVYAVCSR